MTSWVNLNHICPREIIPIGKRSVWTSSWDRDGSCLGWEQDTRLHAKVCQPGPLSEPSWALGARTHVVLGSASTEISSVNEKSLWGDLRHVKRITVAAAGTAPGASEVALPALNTAISSGPSQPGAAVFFFG